MGNRKQLGVDTDNKQKDIFNLSIYTQNVIIETYLSCELNYRNQKIIENQIPEHPF